jgi:hypothetical protein
VVVFLVLIEEFLIVLRFFYDGGHLEQLYFLGERRKMGRW